MGRAMAMGHPDIVWRMVPCALAPVVAYLCLLYFLPGIFQRRRELTSLLIRVPTDIWLCCSPDIAILGAGLLAGRPDVHLLHCGKLLMVAESLRTACTRLQYTPCIRTWVEHLKL